LGENPFLYPSVSFRIAHFGVSKKERLPHPVTSISAQANIERIFPAERRKLKIKIKSSWFG